MHISSILRLALFIFAAVITILAPRADARQYCDTIDFDDRPPFEVIDAGGNQPYATSKGVTFFSMCNIGGGPAQVVSSIGSPAGISNTPSPFNALGSPFGDPLTDCCLIIRFNQPQRYVRLQVAAYHGLRNTPRPTLTVSACNASSGTLITNTVNLTTMGSVPSFPPIVPDPTLAWSTVTFDAGNCIIAEIKVCALSLPDLFQFYIDDVEWGKDPSPPVVSILTPPEKDCICDGKLDVTGILCDPDSCGDMTGELRIRPIISGATSTSGSPPWSSIGSYVGNYCTNTLLTPPSFMLPAAMYPEGEYLIKLIGTNACGKSSSDERVIYIDRNPPIVRIDCPTPGQIVRGKLPVIGQVDDHCLQSWDLRWTQIIPPNPRFPIASFPGPPIAIGFSNVNGVMTIIDTTTSRDGTYSIDVGARDLCNHTNFASVTVEVDNTPPVAIITDPVPCAFSCQEFARPISGIIADKILGGWRLEYKLGGSPTWTTIATGTNPVGNPTTNTPGLIATWNQCNLPRCCYVLRLTAYDRAGGCHPPGVPNITVFEMCANIGNYADCDGDGSFTAQDVSCFLATPPCPNCP